MIIKLNIVGSDKTDNSITLPLAYNYLIQSFIYRNIEPKLAEFLHNKGYCYEKRRFKMFTFSKLYGKYSIDKTNNTINFISPVSLMISSPIIEFIKSIGYVFTSNRDFSIGHNKIKVMGMEVIKNENIQSDIKVKSKSPIVVYSTIEKKDNSKFTYYFNPDNPQFQTLIANNLKKKYQSFYGHAPVEQNVIIKRQGNYYKRVTNYKGFVIEGYEGTFQLSGSKELLKIALEAGIGSKNCQGFGFIQLIE